MKKSRQIKDLLKEGKYKIQKAVGYNWEDTTATQNRKNFDEVFKNGELHTNYYLTKETILALLGMKRNIFGNYKQERDTRDLVALELALSIDDGELKIYLRAVDKDGNPLNHQHAGTHIPIGREP